MGISFSRRAPGKANPVFLILFGLPFAGVGVFMGWMAVSHVSRAAAAARWDVAQARIVEARLKTNTGGDSTTYRVEAVYEYDYKGRTFDSDRVGFSSGSDNIGSYHRRTYSQLETARKEGKTVSCRVNPLDPTESVLFPDVRPEMLAFQAFFVLAFGGAGIGMMIAGIVGARRGAAELRVTRAEPDKPWLRNGTWRGGLITSSNRATAIAMTVFAVFWNLISWPLGMVVFLDRTHRTDKAAWFVLLFPLVGIGIAIAAVYTWLRWRKFGNCAFHMASVPGVIGGTLAGVVNVPASVRPADGFLVKLTCFHRVVTGSGKHRHVREDTVWKDEYRLRKGMNEGDFTRTALPVLFHVPYGSPATETDGNDTIHWRLTASAAVPGIDFAASFEVPVFATPESSPDFVPDLSPLTPYLAQPRP
ncbi:MAG: DUF3592 domain-containing protein [Lentisphaerae bacterium]|nr:DUF3592 domain-containing protein [Lentisphaerota bacterium]